MLDPPARSGSHSHGPSARCWDRDLRGCGSGPPHRLRRDKDRLATRSARTDPQPAERAALRPTSGRPRAGAKLLSGIRRLAVGPRKPTGSVAGQGRCAGVREAILSRRESEGGRPPDGGLSGADRYRSTKLRTRRIARGTPPRPHRERLARRSRGAAVSTRESTRWASVRRLALALLLLVLHATPAAGLVTLDVPRAPASVSIASTASRSLVVQATFDDADGRGVESAAAECRVPFSNSSTWISSSASSVNGTFARVVVGPLLPGTIYICRAFGANGNGTGATGDLIASGRTKEEAPAAPTVSLVQAGSSTAALNVTLGFDGGSAYRRLEVSCRLAADTSEAFRGMVDLSARPYAESEIVAVVATGLAPGVPYWCQAQTRNDIDDSPDSAVLEFYTLPSAPGLPVAEVTPAGPRTLRVVVGWTATGDDDGIPDPGTDGGSPILMANVSCAFTHDGPWPGPYNAWAAVADNLAPATVYVAGLERLTAYVCLATITNAHGTSGYSEDGDPVFTTADAPSAPSIVLAEAVGPSEIRLSLAVADDGGSDLTSAAVACSSSTGSPADTRTVDVVITDGSTSVAVSVSGLHRDTLYYCNATASNAVGTSAATGPVAVRTLASVPQRPVISGQHADTSRQIHLPLTFPDDGGSAITLAEGTCTPVAGSSALAAARNGSVAVSGASADLYVYELHPNTTYSCSATATNGAGRSAASASVRVTTGVDAPEAPTITAQQATSSTGAVLFVAFGFDGGAAVTELSGTCMPESTSSGIAVAGFNSTSVAAGATTAVLYFSSLYRATTYSCRVTAANSVGVSAASASAQVTTPATAPATPSASVDSAGSRTASLAVTLADSGGSPFTLANATCTAAGVPAVTSFVVISGLPSSVALPISNLRPGVALYACSVTVSNAVGASPPASAAFTTAPEVPVAPAILGPHADGTRTIHFAVHITDDGGRPVTGGTAYCAPSLAGLGSPSLSSELALPNLEAVTHVEVVFTNLSPGSVWYCSATLVNDVGTSAGAAPATITTPLRAPPAPVVTVASVGTVSANLTVSIGVCTGAATVTLACASEPLDAPDFSASVVLAGVLAPRNLTFHATGLRRMATSFCEASVLDLDGRSYSGTVPVATVAEAELPPAPAIVDPRATSRSLTLSVAFADNGGSPIATVTVLCTANPANASGGSWVVQSAPPPGATALDVTVAPLAPGRAYYCSANVTSGVGTSPTSAVVAVQTPAEVPATPILSSFFEDSVYARLGMTFGYDGGSPILFATASCAVSSTGDSVWGTRVTNPTSPTTFRTSNVLVPMVSYRCFANLTNAVGTSGPVVWSFTTTAYRPNAPTLARTGTGSRTVNVSITLGASNGAEITLVTVQCTSAGLPSVTATVANSTAATIAATANYTVGNLRPGKPWSCTATARNWKGSSPASNAATFTTLAEVPPPPTLGAHADDPTTLHVAIVIDDDGGSAVTNATAACGESENFAATAQTQTLALPSYIVFADFHFRGLAPLTSYYCEVTVWNVLGPALSPATAVVSTPAAAAAPPAPVVELLDVQSRTATLNLVLGATDGVSVYASATVSFTCANASVPNGPSLANGTLLVTEPTRPTNATFYLAGLRRASYYRCEARVDEATGAGAGAGAARSGAFVVATLPEPPAAVTIASRNGGWKAAHARQINMETDFFEDGGRPVRNATGSCVRVSTGLASVDVNTFTSYTTGTLLSVGSLRPANAYNCTAWAYNDIGRSPDGPYVVITTPPDKPSRPSLVNVVYGSRFVTGTVVFSSDGGSPITFAALRVRLPTGLLYYNLSSVAVPPGAPNATATVWGLVPGSPYTVDGFANNTVGAEDSDPNVDFVALPEPPAAPAVAVAVTGSRSLNVSIAVVFDGGLNLTAANASCATSLDGAPVVAATVNTTGRSPASFSFPFAGLEPGVLYYCRGVLVNALGASPVGAAVAARTLPEIPWPPRIQSAAASSRAIALSLETLFGGGIPIAFAGARCNDTAAVFFASVEVPPDAAGPIEVTVSGLWPATRYDCQAYLTNALGTSPWSDLAPFATDAEPPAAPSRVTAIPINSRSVFVSAALGFDGGAAVATATAACVPIGAGGAGPAWSETVPVEPGARSANFTAVGLVPNTTYVCSASALNAAGASPAASAPAFTTEAEPPAAPALATVALETAREAALSVVFGFDGGSRITRADASCRPAEGAASVWGESAAVPDGAPAAQFHVAGLTPNTTYVCVANATNGVGTGPKTYSAAFTTPAEEAPAPVSVTVSSVAARGALLTVRLGGNGGAWIERAAASCGPAAGGPAVWGGVLPVAHYVDHVNFTVVGLSPNGTFVCSANASNFVGTAGSTSSGAFRTAAEAPAAPALALAAAAPRQLAFAVTLAGDGGSAVSAAAVACFDGATGLPAGSASSPVPGGAASVEVVVAGLRPASNYACNATATNGVGVSGALAALPAATLAEAPAAPLAVSVAVVGSRSAVLNVTFGFDGGARVARAAASCRPAGSGPAGAAVWTGVVEPPAAPRASAAAVGPAALDVTVEMGFDGGSAISEVAVSCAEAGVGAGAADAAPHVASALAPFSNASRVAVRVSGLRFATEYECTAVAVNAEGASPASAPAAATTAADAPAAPSIVDVAAGPRSANVTVALGPGRGSPALSVSVSCEPLGGAAGGPPSSASAPSSYACIANATSAAGTSPTSVATPLSTPAEPPPPASRGGGAAAPDLSFRLPLASFLLDGSAAAAAAAPGVAPRCSWRLVSPPRPPRNATTLRPAASPPCSATVLRPAQGAYVFELRVDVADPPGAPASAPAANVTRLTVHVYPPHTFIVEVKLDLDFDAFAAEHGLAVGPGGASAAPGPASPLPGRIAGMQPLAPGTASVRPSSSYPSVVLPALYRVTNRSEGALLAADASDPTDMVVSSAWALLSGPEGAVLDTSAASSPSFEFPAGMPEGSYVLSYTAANRLGYSTEAVTTVVVAYPAAPAGPAPTPTATPDPVAVAQGSSAAAAVSALAGAAVVVSGVAAVAAVAAAATTAAATAAASAAATAAAAAVTSSAVGAAAAATTASVGTALAAASSTAAATAAAAAAAAAPAGAAAAAAAAGGGGTAAAASGTTAGAAGATGGGGGMPVGSPGTVSTALRHREYLQGRYGGRGSLSLPPLTEDQLARLEADAARAPPLPVRLLRPSDAGPGLGPRAKTPELEATPPPSEDRRVLYRPPSVVFVKPLNSEGAGGGAGAGGDAEGKGTALYSFGGGGVGAGAAAVPVGPQGELMEHGKRLMKGGGKLLNTFQHLASVAASGYVGGSAMPDVYASMTSSLQWALMLPTASPFAPLITGAYGPAPPPGDSPRLRHDAGSVVSAFVTAVFWTLKLKKLKKKLPPRPASPRPPPPFYGSKRGPSLAEPIRAEPGPPPLGLRSFRRHARPHAWGAELTKKPRGRLRAQVLMKVLFKRALRGRTGGHLPVDLKAPKIEIMFGIVAMQGVVLQCGRVLRLADPAPAAAASLLAAGVLGLIAAGAAFVHALVVRRRRILFCSQALSLPRASSFNFAAPGPPRLALTAPPALPPYQPTLPVRVSAREAVPRFLTREWAALAAFVLPPRPASPASSRLRIREAATRALLAPPLALLGHSPTSPSISLARSLRLALRALNASLEHLEDRFDRGGWMATAAAWEDTLVRYAPLYEMFASERRAYLAECVDLAKKFAVALVLGLFAASQGNETTTQLALLLALCSAYLVWVAATRPYASHIETGIQVHSLLSSPPAPLPRPSPSPFSLALLTLPSPPPAPAQLVASVAEIIMYGLMLGVHLHRDLAGSYPAHAGQGILALSLATTFLLVLNQLRSLRLLVIAVSTAVASLRPLGLRPSLALLRRAFSPRALLNRIIQKQIETIPAAKRAGRGKLKLEVKPAQPPAGQASSSSLGRDNDDKAERRVRLGGGGTGPGAGAAPPQPPPPALVLLDSAASPPASSDASAAGGSDGPGTPELQSDARGGVSAAASPRPLASARPSSIILDPSSWVAAAEVAAAAAAAGTARTPPRTPPRTPQTPPRPGSASRLEPLPVGGFRPPPEEAVRGAGTPSPDSEGDWRASLGPEGYDEPTTAPGTAPEGRPGSSIAPRRSSIVLGGGGGAGPSPRVGGAPPAPDSPRGRAALVAPSAPARARTPPSTGAPRAPPPAPPALFFLAPGPSPAHGGEGPSPRPRPVASPAGGAGGRARGVARPPCRWACPRRAPDRERLAPPIFLHPPSPSRARPGAAPGGGPQQQPPPPSPPPLNNNSGGGGGEAAPSPSPSHPRLAARRRIGSLPNISVRELGYEAPASGLLAVPLSGPAPRRASPAPSPAAARRAERSNSVASEDSLEGAAFDPSPRPTGPGSRRRGSAVVSPAPLEEDWESAAEAGFGPFAGLSRAERRRLAEAGLLSSLADLRAAQWIRGPSPNRVPPDSPSAASASASAQSPRSAIDERLLGMLLLRGRAPAEANGSGSGGASPARFGRRSSSVSVSPLPPDALALALPPAASEPPRLAPAPSAPPLPAAASAPVALYPSGAAPAPPRPRPAPLRRPGRASLRGGTPLPGPGRRVPGPACLPGHSLPGPRL
eukprot:tig00000310_g24003.t1